MRLCGGAPRLLTSLDDRPRARTQIARTASAGAPRGGGLKLRPLADRPRRAVPERAWTGVLDLPRAGRLPVRRVRLSASGRRSELTDGDVDACAAWLALSVAFCGKIRFTQESKTRQAGTSWRRISRARRWIWRSAKSRSNSARARS